MDNSIALSEYGRAWVEIDLDALTHNADELRSQLPSGCELMAVVKTDAYGHGAVKVAERMWREGVRSFAVATVGEGISLRESSLDGEILVLGYTPPKDARLLSEFDLTQLIIDGDYAEALNDTGCVLRVHIAIDTGMHRLGINPSNLAELESVYKCNNLIVKGVATHLASPDSVEADDIEFTNLQIKRFLDTVGALRNKGHDTGKLHIQASYGVCNYPELRCDYARIGIALYGVMSHGEKTKIKLDLRPALSLRARVAQVRWIDAGETVSYGRVFKAAAPVKLATVCIGYGDGIPRQMSGKNGQCIIRGQKVPIIGRICMDLLMADATAVDSVQPGDVATFIGRDGGEEISCEEVARLSDTITNDILCRLGSRLPRVYI